MAKAAAKIHGNIYTYWAFHDVLIQHKLISAEASERVFRKDACCEGLPEQSAPCRPCLRHDRPGTSGDV